MNNMPQITTDSLLGIIDNSAREFNTIIDQLSLDASAPEGEWNARQVLSHVIGMYQRLPVLAGFFLAGTKDVPVTMHDPFWMPEWTNAPVDTFKAALNAAVEGNKAFIRSLTPETMWRSLPLPQFGDTPLAVFLLINYQNHLQEQHVAQLRAFVS